MIKNYVDIVQMLDDEMVEIANSEQLEEYVRANYERWAINWMGGNTYVFISDEEIDSVFEETFKAYEFLIDKNNIELDGTPIVDVMDFSAIYCARLSEAHLDKEIFKKDENGKIMYWGFSDTMTEFVECFVK